jgi:uncharacterized C2H2 Zn-finger protein
VADLSFIIVFGTRWHFRPTRGGWDGVLNCPVCDSPQRMVQQHAFKAFTLYWWPLFRTEEGGELVRCTHCGVRFELPRELTQPRSALPGAIAPAGHPPGGPGA